VFKARALGLLIAGRAPICLPLRLNLRNRLAMSGFASIAGLPMFALHLIEDNANSTLRENKS
jgi:hypothetical protein